MDIGTLFGILGCLGLVLGAIMLGGSLLGFVDVPSILIVIGGVILVTFVMFPMKTVFNSFKVGMKTLFAKTPDPTQIIRQIVDLANLARRESLVALEKASVEDEFLKKGVLLVADGTEEGLLRSILETEIAFMRQRHSYGQSIFKAMGNMSPAFGMIGTLIGLINMLGALDDPNNIGPAMAVALLTTFYGAIMANVFFLPMATKLEARSAEEALYMEIIVEGVVSILHGENPRLLQDKLEAFLNPALRAGGN